MMIIPKTSILPFLLLSTTYVSCLPQAEPERLHARAPAPLTIPLVRRGGMEKRDRSIEEWASLSASLRTKYTGSSSKTRTDKRALVTVSMTNQQLDTSYFGQIQVGTPPQPYNVILDTGSADLWLASVNCQRCAAQTTGSLFDISQSSSFQATEGSLDVTYGSGQAVGTLGQDSVTLGGFQVSNQVFGVATSVTNSFLSGNISGLLGLGFQDLASTRANPWWEAASSSWTSPQMSFYMTRFRTQDAQNNDDQPGGQFTLGGTNSSLYDGNINFVNLVRPLYWTIPMTALGTQGGATIPISGSTQNAAIDTGTTLIGGPSSILDPFYNEIPGSARGSTLDPSLQDYYIIPCDTNIQAELTFGGQVYTMTGSDLIGGTVTRDGQSCLGAFFQLDIGGGSSPIPGTSSSVPTWVVGSAFLKNVYTVFQSNPAAVGFAALKPNVQEFGTLGEAGFSIDQNGSTTGTIILSAAEVSISARGIFALWTALLSAVLSALLF